MSYIEEHEKLIADTRKQEKAKKDQRERALSSLAKTPLSYYFFEGKELDDDEKRVIETATGMDWNTFEQEVRKCRRSVVVIELNGCMTIGYILGWPMVEGSNPVQYHLYIITAAHLETTAHFGRESSSTEEKDNSDSPVEDEHEVRLHVFPGSGVRFTTDITGEEEKQSTGDAAKWLIWNGIKTRISSSGAGDVCLLDCLLVKDEHTSIVNNLGTGFTNTVSENVAFENLHGISHELPEEEPVLVIPHLSETGQLYFQVTGGDFSVFKTNFYQHSGVSGNPGDSGSPVFVMRPGLTAGVEALLLGRDPTSESIVFLPAKELIEDSKVSISTLQGLCAQKLASESDPDRLLPGMTAEVNNALEELRKAYVDAEIVSIEPYARQATANKNLMNVINVAIGYWNLKSVNSKSTGTLLKLADKDKIKDVGVGLPKSTSMHSTSITEFKIFKSRKKSDVRFDLQKGCKGGYVIVALQIGNHTFATVKAKSEVCYDVEEWKQAFIASVKTKGGYNFVNVKAVLLKESDGLDDVKEIREVKKKSGKGSKSKPSVSKKEKK